MRSIVLAFMLACIFTASHLPAAAQPVASNENTSTLSTDGVHDGEGRSHSTEHIYRWDAVSEPNKRSIPGSDTDPTNGHSSACSLDSVEEQATTGQAKWEGSKARADNGGHKQPRRLRFDDKEYAGDSGVRWAYGEVQGRWEHIREDEYGAIERPYYG